MTKPRPIPACSGLSSPARTISRGASSQNTDLTVQDIACEERVTAAYIYTLLRLPWLAPDITTAIVNGRQPQQLSAKTLMRKASRFPADWTEQRTLLGFEKSGSESTIDARSSVRSLLDASLLTRLQQKSKPRNAPREIFAVACAEIPRALRLCRKLGSRARQEQARKWRQNRRRQESKNNHAINKLYVGWGGGIRTSAFQNWNSSSPLRSPQISSRLSEE